MVPGNSQLPQAPPRPRPRRASVRPSAAGRARAPVAAAPSSSQQALNQPRLQLRPLQSLRHGLPLDRQLAALGPHRFQLPAGELPGVGAAAGGRQRRRRARCGAWPAASAGQGALAAGACQRRRLHAAVCAATAAAAGMLCCCRRCRRGSRRSLLQRRKRHRGWLLPWPGPLQRLQLLQGRGLCAACGGGVQPGTRHLKGPRVEHPLVHERGGHRQAAAGFVGGVAAGVACPASGAALWRPSGLVHACSGGRAAACSRSTRAASCELAARGCGHGAPGPAAHQEPESRSLPARPASTAASRRSASGRLNRCRAAASQAQSAGPAWPPSSAGRRQYSALRPLRPQLHGLELKLARRAACGCCPAGRKALSVPRLLLAQGLPVAALKPLPSQPQPLLLASPAELPGAPALTKVELPVMLAAGHQPSPAAPSLPLLVLTLAPLQLVEDDGSCQGASATA
jgi:hypothetical protein